MHSTDPRSFFSRRVFHFLATACVLFAGVVCAAAQSAATGTIEGRVFNAQTSEYVPHARVTVDGTTLETFTDSGGQYRITNVPAGSAQVRVFFTGFEPQTETVSVAAGSS